MKTVITVFSQLVGTTVAVLAIPTLSGAQTWQVTTAPELPWRTVAASADFTKIVATGYNGYFDDNYIWHTVPLPIYKSTDSGATWVQTGAPTGYWHAATSSADGTKLAAVEGINYGLIYTSLDSGANWTLSGAPTNNWMALASSADGARLVAVAQGVQTTDGWLIASGIFTSTDSGSTWVPTSAPTNKWISVACSADGVKVVAAADLDLSGDGMIYISTDAGATWFTTVAPSNRWTSVASSADGRKLAAAATIDGFGMGDGMIYVSTNAGATWRADFRPLNEWSSIASSADGTILVAAALDAGSGATISTSTNSGLDWNDYFDPFWGYTHTFAVAADGHIIVAASQGRGIYSLQFPFSPSAPVSLPRIGLSRNGPDVIASWLVPSKSLVLQQSSDLDRTDWTDVVKTPTLNFTNVHYELTVPPYLRNAFFRLRQQ